MMKKINEKGVTLIALVITMIILIILASISMTMLIGDNGIITQSKSAKENTEKAREEEEKLLNDLSNMIASEGSSLIADKTIEQMKIEGTYVSGNTQIKDSKGNKVMIPDGFKVATDSGVNVSEGIVIEDKDISIDGNGENRGNQFVWVPVGNIIKADGTHTTITLGRYTFKEDGTETLVQDAKDYALETVLETYYKELVIARISNGSPGTNGTNTTAKDLKRFIDSVATNNGYYMARYEASYKDGIKPESKVSLIATDSSTQVKGKIWNYITQPKAAQASRAMYSNVNFETDLINSYAWDTAVSYIQKCSGDTDYSKQKSLNTTIANTGMIGDEVCKINDMASNMREWSTEYSTNVNSTNAYPCGDKGGQYYSGLEPCTSYRHSGKADDIRAYFSFRAVLYL